MFTMFPWRGSHVGHFIEFRLWKVEFLAKIDQLLLQCWSIVQVNTKIFWRCHFSHIFLYRTRCWHWIWKWTNGWHSSGSLILINVWRVFSLFRDEDDFRKFFRHDKQGHFSGLISGICCNFVVKNITDGLSGKISIANQTRNRYFFSGTLLGSHTGIG